MECIRYRWNRMWLFCCVSQDKISFEYSCWTIVVISQLYRWVFKDDASFFVSEIRNNRIAFLIEQITSCSVYVFVCVCVKQSEGQTDILNCQWFFPNKMCFLVKSVEEPSVPQILGDPVKVCKGRQIAQ